MRGLELLKIDTEWFKDDNGFIWLFLGENVRIRTQKSKRDFYPGMMTKAEYMKQEKVKHKNREVVKNKLI